MDQQLYENERAYLLENLKTYGTLCGIQFSRYVSKAHRCKTTGCSFEELCNIISAANRLFFRLNAERESGSNAPFWQQASRTLSMCYPLQIPVYKKLFTFISKTMAEPDAQPRFETQFTRGLISPRLLYWSYQNAAYFYAKTTSGYVLSNEQNAEEKARQLQKRYFETLCQLHSFLIGEYYSPCVLFWNVFEKILCQKYPLVSNLSALEKLCKAVTEYQVSEEIDEMRVAAQVYQLISSYLGHPQK